MDSTLYTISAIFCIGSLPNEDGGLHGPPISALHLVMPLSLSILSNVYSRRVRNESSLSPYDSLKYICNLIHNSSLLYCHATLWPR